MENKESVDPKSCMLALCLWFMYYVLSFLFNGVWLVYGVCRLPILCMLVMLLLCQIFL